MERTGEREGGRGRNRAGEGEVLRGREREGKRRINKEEGG